MNILSPEDFSRLESLGMLYVVLPDSTGDYEDYLKANGISGDKMKGQLGNIKIRVKNSEHSACVQRKLFELGYAWSWSSYEISYTDKEFLYAYEDGAINHGDFAGYFTNHNNPEYMFSDEEIEYVPKERTIKDSLGEFNINCYGLPPVSTGLPMPTVKQPKEQGFVRSRGVVVTERMVELANGIAVNAECATKAIPNEWLGELVELNSELREILSNENN